eukprot:1348724-Rhodomonas_salina.6
MLPMVAVPFISGTHKAQQPLRREKEKKGHTHVAVKRGLVVNSRNAHRLEAHVRKLRHSMPCQRWTKLSPPPESCSKARQAAAKHVTLALVTLCQHSSRYATTGHVMPPPDMA